MKCEEFLRLMDDGVEVAEGEAGAHLASCPACRRAVERGRAVSRELRAMRADETPPFLHTRVMAHVREAERAPERRAWWTRRPAWAMPALVVAMIAAAGGYGLFEVMRPRIEPLAAAGNAAGDSAAMGRVAEEAPQGSLAEAMPTPVVRHDAPPVAPAPSGVRARSERPPRAAKEEPSISRRAEKALVPMSFSRDDEAPPAVPAERSRDAVASGLAAPAPPENRAAGGASPGRLAASSQKLAAAEAEPPADVECVLTPTAGGSSIRVRLDAATAPPDGIRWQLVVSQTGAVAVITPGEVPTPATAAAINRSLAPLHLRAGRYTLGRALVE